MKLATLKDGSRDLSCAHHANGIAGTMERLLDDWSLRVAPLAA